MTNYLYFNSLTELEKTNFSVMHLEHYLSNLISSLYTESR